MFLIIKTYFQYRAMVLLFLLRRLPMRNLFFVIIAASALLGAGCGSHQNPTGEALTSRSASFAEFFDGFCQSGAAYRRCSGAKATLDDGTTGTITGWTTSSRRGVMEIYISFGDYGRPTGLSREKFDRLQKVVAEVATATPGVREFRTHVGD